MSHSLCVLTHNDFRRADAAICAARRSIYGLRHLILSPSPRSIASGDAAKLIDRHCAGDNPMKLLQLDGFDERLLMAWYRFLQYDAALKQGDLDEWIVNIDDDDIVIVTDLNLNHIPKEYGIVHGGIVCLALEDLQGGYKAGDVFVRPTKPVLHPRDGNEFKGSFWAIRRRCWADIREVVCRRTSSEDWDMAYHAIRAGWLDYHIPSVVQVQRARQFVRDPRDTESWATHLDKIERWFSGARPRRYWTERLAEVPTPVKDFSAKDKLIADMVWRGCLPRPQQNAKMAILARAGVSMDPLQEVRAASLLVFNHSGPQVPVALEVAQAENIPLAHLPQMLRVARERTSTFVVLAHPEPPKGVGWGEEYFTDGHVWSFPTAAQLCEAATSGGLKLEANVQTGDGSVSILRRA